MSRKKYSVVRVLLCLAALMFSVSISRAQKTDALGTYTPYSMFGLGQMVFDGSSYNMSMGGIGVGIRDNRYINYVNPASITARDTLAFMLDFGLLQKNIYGRDRNGNTSAYNICNMQNFAFTVPIYRKSAFIIGIQPYSNVGYKFLSTETDKELVSEIGDIKYQKYGTGSIYQLFFGAAVTFAKFFTVGAQGLYYFGYIDRHSDILFNSSSSYKTVNTGWSDKVGAFTGKFGIQYEQPFPSVNSELVIGATYKIGTRMNGYHTRYAMTNINSYIDTVMYQQRDDMKLRVAEEFGVGISYRVKDKWMVGVDYIQQNWRGSSFTGFEDGSGIEYVNARYYKAGFEYVPNRYDIRHYMNRVTYRAGLFFEESYLRINGSRVNAAGITIGATFPVLRLYNGITVAINMGQRGSLRKEQVRERYINFMVNFNLHDIWFVKYRYD
ncbi:MAG: hypothetical protein ACI3ZG_06505 [Candidatus Coprenecus sp.]